MKKEEEEGRKRREEREMKEVRLLQEGSQNVSRESDFIFGFAKSPFISYLV